MQGEDNCERVISQALFKAFAKILVSILYQQKACPFRKLYFIFLVFLFLISFACRGLVPHTCDPNGQDKSLLV